MSCPPRDLPEGIEALRGTGHHYRSYGWSGPPLQKRRGDESTVKRLPFHEGMHKTAGGRSQGNKYGGTAIQTLIRAKQEPTLV